MGFLGSLIKGEIALAEPRRNPRNIEELGLRQQPIDFIGVPDRIRTCDPQIRNLVLYPAELRGHAPPLERALKKRQQVFDVLLGGAWLAPARRRCDFRMRSPVERGRGEQVLTRGRRLGWSFSTSL